MSDTMNLFKAILVTLVIAVGFLLSQPATSSSSQAETEVYWRFLNTINIGDVDSGQHERVVLPNFDGVGEMIVVEELNSIFWCTCDSGALYRVDLDGKNFEELFIFDLQFNAVGPVYDFDIDPIARKVYWSEGYHEPDDFQSTTRIKRANFDGSEIEILVDDIENGRDIALDVQSSKIYWGSFSPNQISGANLDGSAIEVVHEESFSTLFNDLEVDSENQTIYWRDGSIYSLRFDGTGRELFALPEIADQVEFPCRCEIDAYSIDRERGVIYWVESMTGSPTRSLYMKELSIEAEPSLIYQSGDFFFHMAGQEGSDTLYAIGTQQIKAFNLNRLEFDPVLFGTSNGRVFEVNPATTRAYEIENFLYEFNLESAEVEPLKLVGFFANDLVFLEQENALYFSENSNVIRKITLDGLEVETVLESQLSGGRIGSMAIDLAENKIYWIAPGQHVARANLDGTDQEILITESSTSVSSFELENESKLVVDSIGQKIYWTERNSRILKRADLDGSDVETLFDEFLIRSMAINELGSKLYFSRFVDNFTPSKIQRADLDGTNIEDVFVEGAAYDIVIPQN